MGSVGGKLSAQNLGYLYSMRAREGKKDENPAELPFPILPYVPSLSWFLLNNHKPTE